MDRSVHRDAEFSRHHFVLLQYLFLVYLYHSEHTTYADRSVHRGCMNFQYAWKKSPATSQGKKQNRVAGLLSPQIVRISRFLLTWNFVTYVKIRPRKACKYPNLRSFGWVSYDEVGVLYSGKLGSRSEARASDLRIYPGLWWKRIKLHLYDWNESEYSPRTCSIGRPAGGTLCPLL